MIWSSQHFSRVVRISPWLPSFFVSWLHGSLPKVQLMISATEQFCFADEDNLTRKILLVYSRVWIQFRGTRLRWRDQSGHPASHAWQCSGVNQITQHPQIWEDAGSTVCLGSTKYYFINFLFWSLNCTCWKICAKDDTVWQTASNSHFWWSYAHFNERNFACNFMWLTGTDGFDFLTIENSSIMAHMCENLVNTSDNDRTSTRDLTRR